MSENLGQSYCPVPGGKWIILLFSDVAIWWEKKKNIIVSPPINVYTPAERERENDYFKVPEISFLCSYRRKRSSLISVSKETNNSHVIILKTSYFQLTLIIIASIY